MQEMNPYRGFESSVDPVLHFGINQYKTVDSIKVVWPNGSVEVRKNISANQRLFISYAKENISSTSQLASQNADFKSSGLFTDITGTHGLTYNHIENEFVDFKIQPLLPHMHSRLGPGLTTADINHDGLSDFYVGASAGHQGSIFIQHKDGNFTSKPLSQDSSFEDMGTLFLMQTMMEMPTYT